MISAQNGLRDPSAAWKSGLGWLSPSWWKMVEKGDHKRYQPHFWEVSWLQEHQFLDGENICE
jgi:hypothetical protein